MYRNLYKEELGEMKEHFTILKSIGLLWRKNKVNTISEFCQSFDIQISNDSSCFTLVKKVKVKQQYVYHS